jgi:DNA-directed RNA polymerase subunit RPC12/RpoP
MQILIKHMKYFEKHLKSAESTEDIDISVHCDVNIFEWLLNYIESDERKLANDQSIKFYDVVEKDGENFKTVQVKRKRASFEIGNAISILISSEYLKMSKLVEECLMYFVENINDILRLPIDMSCIASPLQRKLAMSMTDLQMDRIEDKKDKLLGKLFMNKLHLLLEDESAHLYKCSYCTKLFTQQQQEKFGCPKAKIFIDYHGSVIAKHMLDRSFDSKKFITFLKNSLKYTWRQIYWKIYSHTIDFECKTCDKPFNGAYAKH